MPLVTTAEIRTRTLRPVTVVLGLIVGLLLIEYMRAINAIGLLWGPPAHLQISAALLVLLWLTVLSRRVRDPLVTVLDRLRHPSPRAALGIGLGLSALATFVFYVVAVRQGRAFQPLWHDEFSTLLQTRMLAEGHLWMPPHPLADFFDTFHVLVRPAYASMYFPGAALLYVPAMWLHWPVWLIPLLAAAGAVGLTYRVMREVTDGLGGLLAAIMLMACRPLRLLSLMSMSQVPLLLAGLGIWWAWLRWRGRPGVGWTLIIGLLSGWAILLRPLDALYFIVPVTIAMLWQLAAKIWPAESRREGLISLAAVAVTFAAALLPFAILQLTIDHGVTGSWTHMPYDLYVEQNYPQQRLGFHDMTEADIPSTLPQKIAFDRQLVLPGVSRHSRDSLLQTWLGEGHRLALLLMCDVPHPFLLLLFPLGLLGARDVRSGVVLIALPLFIALYIFYPFFNVQYPLMIVGAVIFAVLAGAGLVEATVPLRHRPLAAAMIYPAIAMLTLFSLGASLCSKSAVADDPFPRDELPRIDAILSHAIGDRKAIVLFRYRIPAAPRPFPSPDAEPVYNWHNAWPDDAKVIRAHDRGEDNIRLYQYYAARDPDRHVFLFDRNSLELQRASRISAASSRPAADVLPEPPQQVIVDLGTAGDLYHRAKSGASNR